jgi:hypothetical protein
LRFTVRRPASAEVSPCCHRPSGGDVACSVHVGVARPCFTGFALKNRLALTVFGRNLPAHRASLRRIRGRNLLNSAKSLMVQTRSEQTPTASADAAIQTAFLCDAMAGLLHSSPSCAGHRAHVEGFDADRVEAASDVRGGLFHPILASVGLTRLELGDRQLRAVTTVGAALGTGQPLLQHLQSPGLSKTQARNAQQFTGRQSGRHHNATVDTHHALVARTSDRIRDVGEGNMPAAGPITGDPEGLNARGHRARQAKTHPPHLGHPHPSQPAIQAFDVTRFHRDLPKSLMHTGFAPCRTPVRPAEKVTDRLGEVPQRLLLYGLRAGRQPIMFGAGRGQLSALLVVAWRAAPGLPVLALFDRQIPHIPGVAAMFGQRHRLLGGRKQPISRHPGNVAAITDKSPKGEPAYPASANARGFDAASIR